MNTPIGGFLIGSLLLGGVALASAPDNLQLAEGEIELAKVAPQDGAGKTRALAEHEVRPGESLWKIAALTVGDGHLWPALYRANRDQIQNPSILYPGQLLEIPEIAPEERAAIRAEAKQYNLP